MDKIKDEFLSELKELIEKTEFTNGLADMVTCLMSTIIISGLTLPENDEIDPANKLFILIGMFEKVGKDYLDVHFGPSPEDG